MPRRDACIVLVGRLRDCSCPEPTDVSGAVSWDGSSHHAAVRAAVIAFVKAHGKKVGLHRAAQAIGISERVARHTYDGGPFAADDVRAARADSARLNLLLDQIARLHAEAAQIQPRGMNVGTGMARVLARAGAVLDRASGTARGEGAQGFRSGALVVTP